MDRRTEVNSYWCLLGVPSMMFILGLCTIIAKVGMPLYLALLLGAMAHIMIVIGTLLHKQFEYYVETGVWME